MSGITITGFITSVECIVWKDCKKFAGKCLSPPPKL
jgi:hypothetical protein